MYTYQLTSTLVKIQAAVCDGDTIGCPTCNIHNCLIPLASQQDRFCPTHAYMNFRCAVTICDSPIVPGRRTCVDLDHQSLENAYFSKGKAIFQLKERLRKARASNGSSNSVPHPDDHNLDNEDEVIVDVETNQCDGKAPEGNRKIQAYFGKRRTHNEQLIMRPCGVIISRATFYGSEAISSVNVRLSSCPAPFLSQSEIDVGFHEGHLSNSRVHSRVFYL